MRWRLKDCLTLLPGDIRPMTEQSSPPFSQCSSVRRLLCHANLLHVQPDSRVVLRSLCHWPLWPLTGCTSLNGTLVQNLALVTQAIELLERRTSPFRFTYVQADCPLLGNQNADQRAKRSVPLSSIETPESLLEVECVPNWTRRGKTDVPRVSLTLVQLPLCSSRSTCSRRCSRPSPSALASNMTDSANAVSASAADGVACIETGRGHGVRASCGFSEVESAISCADASTPGPIHKQHVAPAQSYSLITPVDDI